MSFLARSSSFVRFSVEGELPDNTLEFISDRISSFVFEDIDDNFEEYSVGWVSVLNMFDSAFEYGSHLFGDYVVLSLRVDERKVSPSILNKFTQKEEERIKKEKQVPKLSRTLRLEIKERIRTELTRKAMPVPAVYDLVWSLGESALYFFSNNKKAHMLLEDFFKDCFGLVLMLQIPFTTAAQLVTEDAKLARLEQVTPEIFV
ncbi:MAG: recombination-associated protein RdgC [Desulfofustis sp.]|nr:recombination-associated protein RdgC [Desulfofustis sp.]